MFESICRNPYRLFFPLGILIGLFGVGHWLFYGLGWIQNYSGLMHASIQMQGYLSCFVIGFLLTAMPRLSGAPVATKSEIILFLILTIDIVLFLTVSWWPLADLFFIFWLLSIVRFAAKRVFARRNSNMKPPLEFIWVPLGILQGIIGSALLALGHLHLLPAWALTTGKPMMLQGFLLSIVLGIGGFLGPRLMGVQQLIQPENIRKEEACAPGAIRGSRKKKIVVHVTAGILLFFSFWLEGLGANQMAYGLRAMIVSAIFIFTRVLPFLPRVRHAFTWLLWISFWMILFGSWLEFLFPAYRVMALHFIFLGGFSLMTFSVGTVVVLSHSGEVKRLYQPLPILWWVGACVLGTLLIRALSDFFPNQYFFMLSLAATLWILGALSWLIFMTPKILKDSDDEDFNRQHELAKSK
ncbi:MAG: NnrS family protein [Candidatus Omnitrophica bacterium]|nr:NnrS family protein [Candidatus Omnitrophota bacterium]